MSDAPLPERHIPDPSKPYAEQPGLVLAILTVIGEARGEKAMGKRGVLWCIKNRRRFAREFVSKHGRAHPLFGDGSLASCVLKKYQFSCWLPQDPNLAILSRLVETEGESLGAGAWAVYRALAELVEGEDAASDPTFGATHYCTANLWSRPESSAWYGAPEIAEGRTKELVQIGSHVFARADLNPPAKVLRSGPREKV